MNKAHMDTTHCHVDKAHCHMDKAHRHVNMAYCHVDKAHHHVSPIWSSAAYRLRKLFFSNFKKTIAFLLPKIKQKKKINFRRKEKKWQHRPPLNDKKRCQVKSANWYVIIKKNHQIREYLSFWHHNNFDIFKCKYG